MAAGCGPGSKTASNVLVGGWPPDGVVAKEGVQALPFAVDATQAFSRFAIESIFAAGEVPLAANAGPRAGSLGDVCQRGGRRNRIREPTALVELAPRFAPETKTAKVHTRPQPWLPRSRRSGWTRRSGCTLPGRSSAWPRYSRRSPRHRAFRHAPRCKAAMQPAGSV